MESDERFKHLASDPKFKNLRKKKVEIDERFQSMFTDEKFTLAHTKDKRGRKQDQCEESSSSDESSSSSSDEGDSSDEHDDLEQADIDTSTIQYNWQPLDHDAETAETTTNRLAIQNLDWDHLDVKDIYTLVHSIRPPISVRIYVSEFGKERLAKEEVEGPKELIEMPNEDKIEEEYNDLKEKMRAFKNPGPKTYKINEYEDADEGIDTKNDEVRERIRRYQLNKMKYYYAVAEFDSVESAEVVYKELDGMEYEGSSLELDLRFVPDDIVFHDQDMRAECNKVPDLSSYKAPQFINTALQQTTVKISWDETDTKRQEKLRRAFTKEELERDDLEAYLASETEDESEDEVESDNDNNDAKSCITANSEARVNKYKLLLQSLDQEEANKKKVDVDVEWGNYSDEEDKVAGGQLDADQNSSSGQELDQDESLYVERETNSSKRARKSRRKRRDKEPQEEEQDVELGLLVMDMNKREEEFKFDPDDDRFKAVYESGLYNVDPSHPNFKRTQAFDLMAERKRQRRMNKTNGKSSN